MNPFKFFLLFVLVMLLLQCSDDDSDNSGSEPIKMSISDLSVNEGDRYANFNLELRLNAVSTERITAVIATEDGSAKAIKDYLPIAGRQIVINPGETKVEVEITVIGDRRHEMDEHFLVKIVNTNGPAVVEDDRARVDLINDDMMGRKKITVEPKLNWLAFRDLPPRMPPPFDDMNFGQPSNVTNEDFTSIVEIGDTISLPPTFGPMGDTLLYLSLDFSPSNYEDYLLVAFDLNHPNDSVSTEYTISAYNDEEDELEFKYDLNFMIGTTDRGRLGPFTIDPKISMP